MVHFSLALFLSCFSIGETSTRLPVAIITVMMLLVIPWSVTVALAFSDKWAAIQDDMAVLMPRNFRSRGPFRAQYPHTQIALRASYSPHPADIGSTHSMTGHQNTVVV